MIPCRVRICPFPILATLKSADQLSMSGSWSIRQSHFGKAWWFENARWTRIVCYAAGCFAACAVLRYEDEARRLGSQAIGAIAGLGVGGACVAARNQARCLLGSLTGNHMLGGLRRRASLRMCWWSFEAWVTESIKWI